MQVAATSERRLRLLRYNNPSVALDRPCNLNTLSRLLQLVPHFSWFLQPVLVAAQHGIHRYGRYLQDRKVRPRIELPHDKLPKCDPV